MGVLRSSNTYMAGYATQSASEGAPNLGLLIFTKLVTSCLMPPNRYDMEMEEPQPDNRGAFANEEDPSLSRSGKS